MSEKIEHQESPEGNSSEVFVPPSKGVSALMITQVVSKLLTFMLNQILLRSVAPAIFGISFHLEFLYSTILFFSREAGRLAIQRTAPKPNSNHTYQTVYNFGFVSFMIGIPISLLIMGWQLQGESFAKVNSISSHYTFVVGVYWISVLMELSVEPIYGLYQYTLNFKKRSEFESGAMFLKCVVIVLTVLITGSQDKQNKGPFERNGELLVAFAAGQFSYSFWLFTRYISGFSQTFRQIQSVPLAIEIKDGETEWLDPEVLRFWRISFVQMIFKQFLTEGDKLLISAYFSVESQGVYSVMNNYGSIIVRLLFNPIEESVRLSFTRMLNSKSSDSSISGAASTLQYLLMFYLHLSILMVVAALFNSSFLLKFVLAGKSSSWLDTDLFELMPWYIIHIPFLAFNGVLEAFFSATASTHDTKIYSYFMSGSSIAILVLMYVLVENFKMGILGLIVANSVNMMARIVYCTTFIVNYFRKNGIPVNFSEILPFCMKCILVGGVGIHANYVILGESLRSQTFIDVFKSAGVCLFCLVALMCTVKDDLKTLIKYYFKAKQS
ncbi:Oligosaccharide translocation protein rft1 [Yamadazyma tenuis]|uniref:Man(5)GlcNAc(2)-PP-dolichol translocation protein RFT1 n=1 Tax=Candida tenuis (strain ATCC 10573 / BCRC 21748 / CBS 615 / JCM 9827 / NBRC 10315 / NRRL Y-1498 / VKM Y-70) TaxID=590646 RepID=G3BFE4_CANTC|nr:oligosaccharide translocation protein RFT1 [Yamadazyma tenuis ATCC 10573]EGV60667.1 oligosaccharide translocation protein RFT1 [Yamadazyma tenuis ATCC 10573]WEJ94081.1 Oligosaccharide translocation protein rft1 [Yamadazyma tenuis]